MKYRDYAPTGFDYKGLGLPDRQDWLVAPISIDRDTEDPVTQANWETIQEILGGRESEDTFEIHRFGYWGHGWFEIILVNPALEDKLEEIEAALENYPILDEQRLAEKEMEGQDEAWEWWINSEICHELREYPSPVCTEDELLAWEDGDIRIPDAGDYFDELSSEEQRELFEQALADVGGCWEAHSDGMTVTRDISKIAVQLCMLMDKRETKEFDERQLTLPV